MTIPWGRSPLFHTVPEQALDELAGHAVSRHYGAGEAVCLAGDPGTSLYLVEAGLLHVIRPADNALLVRQRPGDVLGEAAVLTGEPRSAIVLARVPSEVVELPCEDFLAVAERYPMLLANLARLVSRRLVVRTSGRGPGVRHETAAVILEAELIRAVRRRGGYSGGHPGPGPGPRPDRFAAVGRPVLSSPDSTRVRAVELGARNRSTSPSSDVRPTGVSPCVGPTPARGSTATFSSASPA